MAVIKHISIKNASYNATIDYLTTQHDEFTNKPILDEQGRRIPRVEFLLDGINCDPESKQTPVRVSRMDKAVTYIQNHRSYLTTYLEDGRSSF